MHNNIPSHVVRSLASTSMFAGLARPAGRLLGALLLLLGLMLGLASGSAQAQQAGKNFDHTKTGFTLTGQHKQQRCESCHLNGVFKGTPRDCASCHTAGARFARGNQVMPQNHIVTNRSCDTCHGTQGFSGARFSHTGVKTGQCASCHNGVTANGKSSGHVATSESCDSCHRIGAAWASNVVFNHSGVAAGSCASCHNGNQATGQPNRHVPNTSVTGMGNACDSCHRGGFTAWLPAKVHANFSVTSQCATCHTGSFAPAVAKPANTLHANVGACETCHKSTSAWQGSKVDHSGYGTSTSCVSCHDGKTAGGKNASHIPSGSLNCTSCHSVTGWKPTTFNHTQVAVTGQCASCHSGAFAPADGPVANHISTKALPGGVGASCDACHKGGYTSWNPGTLHRNVNLTSGCASCHNAQALGATQKPATAVHNGVTVCETCHASTAAWATGGRPDHSAYSSSTNCASCHNGSTAPGKGTAHIPISLSCISCHTATAATWKPTLWNHTQSPVTGQCATCHSGGFAPADGPVVNHIAYKAVPSAASANCDACHKAGYASWNPGTFHRNVSVTSGCSACHNAGALGATQKPATAVHNGVTVCETCHTTTSNWSAQGRPDHGAYTSATNCASCHNGGTAPGKSTTHIPTSLNCISCHTATAATWKPTLWNHSQGVVTGQCATCHTGAYAPADGPVANHIAYKSVPAAASANCDTCHKAGYTSWNPGAFHRNISVSTGCASCHNANALGATQKPNTAVHAGVTACEGCHTTTSSWAAIGRPNHSAYTAATVCSTCHNGSTAPGKTLTHIPTTANCISCHTATAATWKPTLWNHSQVVVTSQCATCHTGAYAPADGPVANHVPYKTVPAAAALNCDGCHKAGYAGWNPGYFHRNVTVSSGCASCHLSAAYLGPTQTRPNNATHAGATVCESCHKSTSAWASATTFTHAAANAVGTGTCDTCHNGGTAKGKSATHIPITAATAKCDSCHRSQAAFATALTMNHSAVATMSCKTCHNGSYLSEGPQGAQPKPSNHIPESQLLNGASMDCNACHTSTSVFTTLKMNHNSSMGSGAGLCRACHQTGVTFLGGADKKSITHQQSKPVPTDCSQAGCHKPLGNKGAAYTRWN